MYGYSSSEIIGRSIEITAPPERPDETGAVLDRVKAGQFVDHYETVRVRKDGSPVAVSICVAPIRDEEGAIVGASGIVRDVTDRRVAFEAARAMIESSQDSLVSISPEGKITDVNQATTKITGVPPDELIGTAFSATSPTPRRRTRSTRWSSRRGEPPTTR